MDLGHDDLHSVSRSPSANQTRHSCTIYATKYCVLVVVISTYKKSDRPNCEQGRSDGGYIGIYTLPKSGQVNFYGVKTWRLNGYWHYCTSPKKFKNEFWKFRLLHFWLLFSNKFHRPTENCGWLHASSNDLVKIRQRTETERLGPTKHRTVQHWTPKPSKTTAPDPQD